MGFALLNYVTTNSKSRAMFGKLLSKEDYNNLLEKRTVRDIAIYLKKHTYYSDILDSVNENNIHRSELEILSRTSLYNDFVKLLNYLRGDSKKFLEVAFLKHEVGDIKILLRGISTPQPGTGLEYPLIFLNDHSPLDYFKLASSKNVTELIYNLKGTQYYKPLQTFADYEERQNLFNMEMALDLHYYTNILKMKDKLLTGQDNKSVTKSFGNEIDITNIMLIYRSKKIFNLSKEATLNHVVPFWYNISKKTLVELAGSSNIHEFKELVAKTKYAFIFKPNQENFWEINANSYLYRLYKRVLREGKLTISSMISYLHLKEIDIDNIITITEGVRYKLPSEEIRNYLIGINRRGGIIVNT